MNDISYTIKTKRKELGLTAKDVVTKLSDLGVRISEKTLYGWESGHSQPDAEKFVALCSVYNIGSFSEITDINELAEFSLFEKELIKKYRILDVHGKRVVEGALSLEYDRMTHVVERKETGNVTYITLYDLAYSAGLGEPMGDTYFKTKLELPTERVPENAHCCVKVNGDSMEPAYYSGDIVFVQRQDEFIREGEIGIFVLNGEGYIKKLGDRELVSLNPDYKPIEIHEFDDLRCQGRVLGKL